MKGNTKYFVVVASLALVFSCNQSQDEDKKYFDLPGFFKTEIESLSKSTFEIEKSVNYNGKQSVQTKKSSELNWDKEWNIFLESDINKPAYYAGMTETKRPLGEETSPTLEYQALSKSLPVRELSIVYLSDSISRINIKVKRKNLISTTEIKGTYLLRNYWEISGEQTIKYIGKRNTFNVKGLFK